LNIEEYLQQRPELGLRPEGTRGEWRGSCPFHSGGSGGKNFAINVHTGQFLCRASSVESNCGIRGSFPLFYKLVEGIASWAEVKKRLHRDVPIKNWDEFLGLLQKGDRELGVNYQELPSDAEQYRVTPAAFPYYLQSRGYDARLCDYGFDLRVAFAGEFQGRLLLPFFDLEGRLLTFTARAMDDYIQPRYRFPSGATSDAFLFGVHRLASAARVTVIWVVEGQFDVIHLAWLGEYAVALSTGTMSSRQALDIRRLFDLFRCPVLVCLDKNTHVKGKTIWAELRAMGVDARFVDISNVAKDPGLLIYENMLALKMAALGGCDG
jgi:hypothetical protein